MSTTMKNKYCSICGEQLEIDYRFCPGCGVAVINNDIKGNRAKKNNQKNLGKNSESKKSRSQNSNNEKKSKTNNEQETVKILSRTKLFYLSVFLILLCLIIIYSSYIINETGITKSSSSQNEVTPQNSGVDLQNLQQINALEEAVKNNPKNNEKLLELAHLLNDSGLKERAIEKYKLYLRTNPKEPDVLVDMGVCYFELGKNDEAIKWMKEALKYQPKHQIAHLNLGVVSLKAGKHDEAMEWWKKAVEIDPRSNIGKRAQEFINSH